MVWYELELNLQAIGGCGLKPKALCIEAMMLVDMDFNGSILVL